MMSELTAACLFGLFHFAYALYFFLILGLVNATDPREPITRLRFFSENFFALLAMTATLPLWITHHYEGSTFTETCLLGLLHALVALAFAHYLKVCLDFRGRGPIISLSVQLFFELFGIVLLASTFFAAWSMVLVIFLHSLENRV
jgi:hypothetical protein